MAPKFFIIVNPTSGGGAGVRMPAEVVREMDARHANYEVHVTRGPGHAAELAETAALDHKPVVVAAGGDGTVHEVANGLLRAIEQDPATPTIMGILPVGTGNDYVKMIPGTAKRPAAYDTLLNGRVRKLDAGYACWQGGAEYFVNAAGTGIDVEVVRKLGRRGRGGALHYIAALLRALRSYQALPVRISADGQQIDERIMTVAIANGRCIGGTFRICPEARADDGRFDVCVVEGLGLARSLVMAAAIIRGSHTDRRGVRMLRAGRVELGISSDAQLFFQLDGELREPTDARTLTLEIRPSVLPVLSS